MWKKFWIVVIILIIIFGGIYSWHLFINYKIGQYFKTHKTPPVVVNVTPAKAATWHDQIDITGTTVANQGVNVTSEVSGNIVKIFFHSGQFVKKGQPIVELNPNILKAQLQNNEASLDLSKINYQRQQLLYKQDASAASDLDTARAKYFEDIAILNQTKAQLAQTLIRAPFSGRLGIRQIDLGQYLKAGDTVVNLQALDPMYADFDVSENNIAKLQLGQSVIVSNNAFPDKTFTGKIIALDAALNANTRSLKVRVSLPNHENVLVPGMFVHAKIILPKTKAVVLAPQIAITYSPVGDYLYTVQSGKAVKTYVTLGDRRSDKVAVLKGLNDGDSIVYAGQLKLRQDMPVKVVPPTETPTYQGDKSSDLKQKSKVSG